MPRVLAVGAHPDDVEITCAGTLVLFQRAGWKVSIASMTAGDLGSSRLPPREISRVRREEARRSAASIHADYTCLGFRDLAIVYDEASKRRVSGFLRQCRPDLLFLPSPVDYMADHEETPRIVREAAFASTIPHWRAAWGPRVPPPCERLPAIFYVDAIDLVDHFGRRIAARYVVDVTGVMGQKERMLAAHESQRSWLREQHGEDEYLLWMKRCGRDRARDFGKKAVRFAEGFRPHLGHGFPKGDVLTEVLGKKLVRTLASP
jgi:LmbE family N-acetylglucosaminyl deacetylase